MAKIALSIEKIRPSDRDAMIRRKMLHEQMMRLANPPLIMTASEIVMRVPADMNSTDWYLPGKIEFVPKEKPMSKTKAVKELELKAKTLEGALSVAQSWARDRMRKIEELEGLLKPLLEIEARHKTTLAGRLLAKGANFICIEADEPYFLEVYRTVRQNAKRRGTWTDACEKRWLEQVGFWADREVVKER